MPRSFFLLASLASVAHCAVSHSADIISTLSFGHGDKISPNGRAIPDWYLSGENHHPQILSDRVILTPPAPGHARGALWADAPNLENHWTAEATFRVGGQDRGSGNFQIWYVKDGRPAIGSNSVYTVPSFDGLVLAVDQHGGRGGMLRGFLNDGSTNYKDHHLVDSLAFAHCDFIYRNQGRSSVVQIVHDTQGLRVNIDGQHCFSSREISLPQGYHFGMTAATADNPDSFEINSFIVTKTTSTDHGSPAQQSRSEHHDTRTGHMPNAPEQIPDKDASLFKKQEEQFADLHDRLQVLSHQINSMFDEFEHIAQKIDDKHNELVSKVPKSSEDGVSALARRVEGLEKILRNIEQDLTGRDYHGHLTEIRQAVEGVKGGLHQDLPDKIHHIVKGSGPKLTTIILSLVAVQIVLFGLYTVYRKRRDNAPKKYL